MKTLKNYHKNYKNDPYGLFSQAKAVVSSGKCHDAGLPWQYRAFQLYPILLKHVSTITKNVNFGKITKKLKNDPSPLL